MLDPSPTPGPPWQDAAPLAGIGIFDSGLGGLSVLRALRRQLPAVSMTYVADSAHAPYGERSADEVCQRSMLIASRLVDIGARLLVVACNTATAAAIPQLRARWPELPIVGVEPGVKPALRVSRSGRIGVMATEGTLRSSRFRALLEREVAAAGRLLQRPIVACLQACPGLAAAIECGELDGEPVRALVERFCAPLRQAGVDAVVLGCTHYPFVAPLIDRALGPGVELVDTAEAVARQAGVRWAALPPSLRREDAAAAVDGSAGTVKYVSSGDVQRLHHAVTTWLGEHSPNVGRFDDLPRRDAAAS